MSDTSQKSPDVLVLEDYDVYQKIIMDSVPPELSAELVATAQAFREALRRCFETKVFIIDDKVPETTGGIVTYYFIKNAAATMKMYPDAKIFYTGSSPDRNTFSFCRDHQIPLIEKTEVGNVLLKLVQESSSNTTETASS